MIVIIAGPPCSGKSTYVKENAKNEDIVIDMDRIALALVPEGAKSFGYGDKVRKIARAARLAAVKEAIILAQGERYINTFIIHTDPSADQRRSYRSVNAQIVELDPGKDVCLSRLELRPEQNQLVARYVIDEYYAKRGK